MKTKLFVVLFFTSVLFSISCSKNQMSVFIEKPEKGFNGSFEEIENKIPVNWLIYTQQTAQTGSFKIFIDTVEAVTGKNALTFDVESCSNKGGWFSPGISTQIDAVPGKNYKLSFYIKNNGANYKVKLGGITATTGNYDTFEETNKTYDSFTQVEYFYQMPQNRKTLRFEFNILSKGIVTIDDIKIEAL